MKEKLKNYFKIWWVPILSYLFILVVFILGSILRRDWIIDLSLILFFINIIGSFISSIVQIVIKKWFFIIPQLGISAFLFFYVSIIFTFSPPDYYGAHKEIPEGIDINEPIDNEPTEIELKKHDLILASSHQPGIYYYFTDYKPSELGGFYIKAFEINSNDKLSESRMKKRSIVKVENIQPKLYKGEFTIYEGSWGDKYGAKIELWFNPLNGEKDYKITERNYIIEGWMR